MRHCAYFRRCPGSDTAVLLIHGICGSPDHFRELLPLIPEGWSVYNLLLEGHGAGVKDFGKASMAGWKRQVSAQIDEILAGHRKLLIIGHSMGTLFAIGETVKRQMPGVRLFLLNCPLRIRYTPRTMARALRVAFGAFGQEDVQTAAMASCCGIQLTPKLWQYLTWIPRFLELFREIGNTKKRLPLLESPCRSFQGREDELVPLGSCKVLGRNPRIRVTVLPESSHYYYSPQDLTLLRECLREEINEMNALEVL